MSLKNRQRILTTFLIYKIHNRYVSSPRTTFQYNDLFFPMESVASNSSSFDNRRFRPIKPIADRIVRALRHHLRLLHRLESKFFVLGATGNVYTVALSSTPSCTCPDRTTPCKHILFVFIRVLGVSLDDACLRRRNLRPCHVNRLLETPTAPGVLAGASVRERFHQLFFQARQGTSRPNVEIQDGIIRLPFILKV